jgi:hypothetical protein
MEAFPLSSNNTLIGKEDSSKTLRLNEEDLYKKICHGILAFNLLFYDIAPILSNQYDIKRDPATEISQSMLSGPQKQEITVLSGVLQGLYNSLHSHKVSLFHINDPKAAKYIPKQPKQEFSETEQYVRNQQREQLLKDLLVRECYLNEELENAKKESEDENVELTAKIKDLQDEIVKLKKRLQNERKKPTNSLSLLTPKLLESVTSANGSEQDNSQALDTASVETGLTTSGAEPSPRLRRKPSKFLSPQTDKSDTSSLNDYAHDPKKALLGKFVRKYFGSENEGGYFFGLVASMDEDEEGNSFFVVIFVPFFFVCHLNFLLGCV